jgi:raffinose/stachyose/melibiose transport system substrate-binding protein
VNDMSRPVSRRELLRASAAGAGVLTLGPFLSACGGDDDSGGGSNAATGGRGGKLKMWWWGEQEAVGIQEWVDTTLSEFKKANDTSVNATLMDTNNVVPQFTNAAAAGKPPDVQFLFNGIYHMENVWLGYIEPLNGLVDQAVLDASGATKMSTYEGKQYRVGFYSVPFGIAYNKAHFEKAGLDPDAPPKTWDEFTEACTKLKAGGHIPIGGGVKDGFLGEWYMVQSLTQNLNSSADALNLFIGDLDWRAPEHHEHWVKLEELKKSGFFNDDIASKELYQGIQLFDTGKASMCFNTGPALPNSQKKLGADKVGFMIMPVFGDGSLAGKPISDSQGFGIPVKGKNHEQAAKFLEFMHSQDRVDAMWSISKQIPADTKFDGSKIDVPLLKDVNDNWIAADHADYIADLMPTKFWTDAMFVASQKILAGSMTGDQAGDLAKKVADTWKKQNPDMVERYKTWGQDLA